MSKVELRGLGAVFLTQMSMAEGRGAKASAARKGQRPCFCFWVFSNWGQARLRVVSTASCICGGVKSWNLYLPPFTFAFGVLGVYSFIYEAFNIFIFFGLC